MNWISHLCILQLLLLIVLVSCSQGASVLLVGASRKT
jgi:hypothetical protein